MPISNRGILTKRQTQEDSLKRFLDVLRLREEKIYQREQHELRNVCTLSSIMAVEDPKIK